MLLFDFSDWSIFQGIPEFETTATVDYPGIEIDNPPTNAFAMQSVKEYFACKAFVCFVYFVVNPSAWIRLNRNLVLK